MPSAGLFYNKSMVKPIDEGRIMKLTVTQSLSLKQKWDIVGLWNLEFPKVLYLEGVPEFDRYLDSLSDKNHILLTGADAAVKGWLVYFMRDGEQCFAMLLDASLQGQGWGTRILELAKKRNSELVGWVIDNDNEFKRNGSYYKSPIAFYRKNGFKIQPDIRLEKKNISGIKVIWKKAGDQADTVDV